MENEKYRRQFMRSAATNIAATTIPAKRRRGGFKMFAIVLVALWAFVEIMDRWVML